MSVLTLKRASPPGGEQHHVKRVRIERQDILPSEACLPSTEKHDTEAATEDAGTSSGAESPNNSHVSTPSSYPCREKTLVCDFPGCGKAYNRPVRLAEHQRSHTNERPFACDWEGCGKTFLRDTHLKRHIKSSHENVRDWKCDWPGCDKAFATGTRMRVHRKQHEQNERFRCTGFEGCTEQFRKKETLQRHVASVHLQDAPYACEHIDHDSGELCGKRFNQSSSLVKHNEREHSKTSKKRYFCNQCSTGETFSHQNSQPPDGFASYGDLVSHMKTVHPPTCNLCGRVCSTTAQLKAHVDIDHVDLEHRRVIECKEPGCPRKFTKKGNMLVHFRSAHEQQKFVCGEFDVHSSSLVPGWSGEGACGHGFSTKASLEKHIRTQHLHLPLIPSKGRDKRTQRKARMAEQKEEHGGHAQDHRHENDHDDELLNHGLSIDHEMSAISRSRLPCALAVCPHTFVSVEDLGGHLEAVHGYSSLAAMDAAEAVNEKEALSGGRFWIGGDEDGPDFDEGAHDLADRLAWALARHDEDRSGPGRVDGEEAEHGEGSIDWP